MKQRYKNITSALKGIIEDIRLEVGLEVLSLLSESKSTNDGASIVRCIELLTLCTDAMSALEIARKTAERGRRDTIDDCE